MKRIELTYVAYSDLFRQLALLLHSGVSICEGLQILIADEKDLNYAEVLRSMANSMESGATFAEALAATKLFPAYAVGLIEISERVGKSEETLTALADYYEKLDSIGKSLRNALTYPAILLVMMLIVIIILLSKVLPVFNDVYHSLGGSLSGIAAGLLSLGNILDRALPVVGIIVGALIIIAVLCIITPPIKIRISRLFTSLFGDLGIRRRINNARIVDALSLVLASGLPIEEGLSLASNMLKDCPSAHRRCNSCLHKIEQGEDLVASLTSAKIITESEAQILKLAMRAGTSDTVIKQIADRSAEEAEVALEQSVSRVESAMVLITSLMVGAILLAVMIPLINIMNAIG